MNDKVADFARFNAQDVYAKAAEYWRLKGRIKHLEDSIEGLVAGIEVGLSTSEGDDVAKSIVVNLCEKLREAKGE